MSAVIFSRMGKIAGQPPAGVQDAENAGKSEKLYQKHLDMRENRECRVYYRTVSIKRVADIAADRKDQEQRRQRQQDRSQRNPFGWYQKAHNQPITQERQQDGKKAPAVENQAADEERIPGIKGSAKHLIQRIETP